jgi:hypothetical protein
MTIKLVAETAGLVPLISPVELIVKPDGSPVALKVRLVLVVAKVT